MYFYWKICYFGHFLYTAPGQPGGGQDFIRGAGAPPPWPHAGYGPDCIYCRHVDNCIQINQLNQYAQLPYLNPGAQPGFMSRGGEPLSVIIVEKQHGHLINPNKSEFYPNISTLLQIFTTLPCTSATEKRSFSTLRRITRFLRSKPQPDL